VKANSRKGGVEGELGGGKVSEIKGGSPGSNITGELNGWTAGGAGGGGKGGDSRNERKGGVKTGLKEQKGSSG